MNPFTEFRRRNRPKPEFVTHFGDTEVRIDFQRQDEEKMSEYYLADQKAEERARQQKRDRNAGDGSKQAQDVKITLLGDFLFPSQEPQGFDPYNHVNGKSLRDAWKYSRNR